MIETSSRGMVQVETVVTGDFGAERKIVLVTKKEAKKKEKTLERARLKGLKAARVANNITR